MASVTDRPDLLARLGEIQRQLVSEAHRMARAASALDGLPQARYPHEALCIILRAACERLGFDRAYAFLAEGDALGLRASWPQGRRAAGQLERQAIQGNRATSSRTGKTTVVPLHIAGAAAGALRLERRTAAPGGGDVLAPIMRFAEAAARALENAVLAERVRSQDLRIETLSVRLAEANHRIKNNLQALAGFLAEHQHEPGFSPRASRALADGIGRIKAIAALHEALSFSEDEATDLAALTHRICAETANVGQAGDRIRVVVTAAPVRVGPRVCRAFALILHELVSNALRHAYPDHQSGEVRVSLCAADGQPALEVADDGVGIAVEGGAVRSRLGLSVAAAIAEHELGGKLEFSAERGTTVRLRFPLAEMA
jgi:two-component sensor histidine kinase